MLEQERLQELYGYKVLDTLPEKDLDELAEIASAICDTPISLVSLVDAGRQWFKSKIGLERQETPLTESFCQHALHNPNEVLVVENPLDDIRFKHNPMVLGNPNIRFYAGAPLETPSGHVLGTLCVIDDKPRTISERQKKALQLLAKKVMEYLESRKLILDQKEKIEIDAARLKKLTDYAPGAIYQFELKPDGSMTIPFASKGVSIINANLSPEGLSNNPSIIMQVIHPDDLEDFRESVRESMRTASMLNVEFRTVVESGKTNWVSISSRPEWQENGTVIWYGIMLDITEKKEYIKTLEQILFDISHVIRRPTANLLGLATAIQETTMEPHTLQQYVHFIKSAAEELDGYIGKLNNDYSKLKSGLSIKI